MFGRTSVGWLSNFKKERSISPQPRANIPHPCLSALNMVRWARWLNVSAFWLISIWLLNSQDFQIEFTDNICSLEESNRKRTLAQKPQRTWKLVLVYIFSEAKLLMNCWLFHKHMLSPVVWVGGYLRVPNKQQNTYSIHTCMMNTLAIPLLTWNYPTQE